jgi:hypothetical protein
MRIKVASFAVLVHFSLAAHSQKIDYQSNSTWSEVLEKRINLFLLIVMLPGADLVKRWTA